MGGGGGGGRGANGLMSPLEQAVVLCIPDLFRLVGFWVKEQGYFQWRPSAAAVAEAAAASAAAAAHPKKFYRPKLGIRSV
jgi:hypothetical protein